MSSSGKPARSKREIAMGHLTPPFQILFDAPAEIFASDTNGTFLFPLLAGGNAHMETAPYDEVRFVVSIWHPAGNHVVDFDRAYVELRGSFDPDEEHWTKLAEIEPVVPPYNPGASFDGWIVLPVLASVTAFVLFGSGFAPRSRLQLRVSAYFVA